MKKNIFILLLLSCVGMTYAEDEESLIQYVDPRVGTAASTTTEAGLFGRNTEELGQTLPAVLSPNGMTFWTPQTRDTEKKCVAPYYYADTLLQGFRASHWLVGGCTQDYGSMTISPLFDHLRTLPEERATPFSHEEETSTPAYYTVTLPEEHTRVEMTGTKRCAIFRMIYSEKGKAYLVVNPNSDEGEGHIAIDPKTKRIYGSNPVHRIYQGWGESAGFSGHFLVEYTKEPTSYGVYRADSIFGGENEISGPLIGAYIEFDVTEGETLLAKVSTSFVDLEGAKKNLEKELPHWDFDHTRKELTRIWEERLGRIRVETTSREAKEKFYGALYRASFLPRTMNDVDGRYSSFSTGIPIRQTLNGATYYDDYSMWDTYRALHPLLVLIEPRMSGEMMQSLVEKYEQGNWMPIFPCWNSYTAAMIGDHVLSAISDAYVKGVREFDIERAYEGMRQNAFDSPSTEDYLDGKGRRALKSYLEYGYIPLEDSVMEAFHTREQVSRTIEYAYDDFALSQVARLLGKAQDYDTLIHRALNYRNVIDPRTGYAQGRHANGEFLKEDNAFSFVPFITEGAPCHYTWYAPQDPYGLMECMGGREMFVDKLDSMFSCHRYWHGNEPCHQVAFMFNYAGEPWKTQRTVRHILLTEYFNSPGGLSGNDDAGQMSAWYVFASMGMYPVCPATPYYMLASPSFPSMTIHPEGGNPFTVKAIGASEENIYIQSATLNGQPYTHNYLSHEDMLRGGTLEFVMGPEPNTLWGSREEDLPPNVMN